MSIETITKDEIAYKRLVEDIRKIIFNGRLAVGIELLRIKWNIGDRILSLPEVGRLNSGRKTQTDLANDLGIQQQRISEYIRFRKIAGNDFELYVKSLLVGTLAETRDIRLFLLPHKELTKQDIEKKQNELQRQIEKREREDEKLKAESLASFKVLSIHESIDMLTNKLVEGYVFPDYCIGLLKTLADEIRRRYPDKDE